VCIELKKVEKHWSRPWSISPTFYKQLFYPLEFFTAFLYFRVFYCFSLLTVKLCNFLGKKAAHNMLVELAPGVNFTNLWRKAQINLPGIILLCRSVSPTNYAELYQ